MSHRELPERIYEMAELAPVEDVLLTILREKFPDVNVSSRIPQLEETHLFPLIVARGAPTSFGVSTTDARFIGRTVVAIHTFTQDSTVSGAPSGDQQGAVLSEAVRVALRDVSLDKPFIPDIGTILAITMTASPRRVADWATSTGPVQYADLPGGVWRYETLYRVTHRRPLR